jgi:hypothetical protein
MISEQERVFSRMFGRYTPSGEVREVPRHLGHGATEIDGDGAINDADEQRAVHARLGSLPAAAQAA